MYHFIVFKDSCPRISATDLCQRSYGHKRNGAKTGVRAMCTVHPLQASLRAHIQVRLTQVARTCGALLTGTADLSTWS